MAVSVGNVLYETYEREDRLYYFEEINFKNLDHEAASDHVLLEKATYVFEIVKHPLGFSSEQIMIKNGHREMAKLNYNFKKPDKLQ